MTAPLREFDGLAVSASAQARCIAVFGEAVGPDCSASLLGSRGGRYGLAQLFASNASALFAIAPSHEIRPTEQLHVHDPGRGLDMIVPLDFEDAFAGSQQFLKLATAGAAPLRLTVIACPYYVTGGARRRDPILSRPRSYGAQLGRILTDLFDRPSPSLLAHPDVSSSVEIASIFDPSLQEPRVADAPEASTLVRLTTHAGRRYIEASRRRVQRFLETAGLVSDVAVVLSAAPTADPTGWFGTDSVAEGGVSFTYDARTGVHAYRSALPGVIAFASPPIRPYQVQHELLHALSSYNNGQVLDEYDLTPPHTEPGTTEAFAINKRFQVEEESGVFAVYNGVAFAAQSVMVHGRRLLVPKPANGTNCIMHRLHRDPIPDPLIECFLLDRLRARAARSL